MHLPSSPGDAPFGSRSQMQPVYEGSIRVGPLIGVPPLLLEFGLDPLAVLTAVGLEVTLLADPENMISYSAMGRLLKVCAEQTRCPHFGLLVGQRAGLDCLGLIGRLPRYVLDVGTALRGMILHLHLHDRGAVPALSVERSAAVLSYVVYQPGVAGTFQIYDAAIAIIYNIMRTLCGPGWLPKEVLFAHRQPQDPAPYRSFFQAPLRFDQEQTALVFAPHWLHATLRGADPLQRQQFGEQIKQLVQQGQRDVVGKLRCALAALTMTRSATLEQAAELFSMHPRTLNRRLAEKGCTFRGLAEEVRYDLARQFLENTGMPISQIAAVLGYAETSAFTRAFRRWSGFSPTVWQEQMKTMSPLPTKI
ncbi:MAG: DNA-binding domain-containing protein, AraC-type [Solidesulfovibrio magneticus str. Maddingley MBC34]|uniref:DNA-binding domain-containing protein, AraC-type n=1 Tax=Solidesulfovibrio magneticus str. Maddingley MBC34 TaxID=1206767 RepID=K6FRL3_9BACT|nr:MAG: DNA-binding domain-containing protein, AraC-type [Solidesulfovibrio magneticus str. Maddingley MBC34]